MYTHLFTKAGYSHNFLFSLILSLRSDVTTFFYLYLQAPSVSNAEALPKCSDKSLQKARNIIPFLQMGKLKQRQRLRQLIAYGH